MYSQYIARGFQVMSLWGCLLTAIFGGMMTGCSATGLYGRNMGRLDMATQAFFARDWPLARTEFAALAMQTRNQDAMTAGAYGLACIDMATAEDVTAFLEVLNTLFEESADRFKNQNPELFILAARNGIQLMEKKDKDQADQLLHLRQEEKRSAETIRKLEQSIEHLKHQIQVLERIDQELQEKRNPS